MRTSLAGIQAITKREGVRYAAYRDTKGIWTIGVGHTAAAGPPIPAQGMRITPSECDEILARDLLAFEKPISAAVKVIVSPNEFDALVSLAFNIGIGGFLRSTVLRKLNAGDRTGAAHAFMLWNKPPEIIGRRASEMRQFSAYASQPDVLSRAADKTRANADRAARQGAGAVVATAPAAAGAKQHSTASAIGVGLAVLLIGGALLYKWRRDKRHAEALETVAAEPIHG
jgi:lysozyme